MATSVSEFDIENWLRKVVEWSDTTTLKIQQDVCLHLPKLHEFLLQIYETLKHMVSSLLREISLNYWLKGRGVIKPSVSHQFQTYGVDLSYVSLSKRQIRIKRYSNLFPPLVIYCQGGFHFIPVV